MDSREPTEAELEQLAREPDTHSTAGPRVAGFLTIGHRSIPLAEDEARALFGIST